MLPDPLQTGVLEQIDVLEEFFGIYIASPLINAAVPDHPEVSQSAMK